MTGKPARGQPNLVPAASLQASATRRLPCVRTQVPPVPARLASGIHRQARGPLMLRPMAGLRGLAQVRLGPVHCSEISNRRQFDVYLIRPKWDRLIAGRGAVASLPVQHRSQCAEACARQGCPGYPCLAPLRWVTRGAGGAFVCVRDSGQVGARLDFPPRFQACPGVRTSARQVATCRTSLRSRSPG